MTEQPSVNTKQTLQKKHQNYLSKGCLRYCVGQGAFKSKRLRKKKCCLRSSTCIRFENRRGNDCLY